LFVLVSGVMAALRFARRVRVQCACLFWCELFASINMTLKVWITENSFLVGAAAGVCLVFKFSVFGLLFWFLAGVVMASLCVYVGSELA